GLADLRYRWTWRRSRGRPLPAGLPVALRWPDPAWDALQPDGRAPPCGAVPLCAGRCAANDGRGAAGALRQRGQERDLLACFIHEERGVRPGTAGIPAGLRVPAGSRRSQDKAATAVADARE